MKVRTISACLLVMSSLPASAFADDSGWYLDADLGRASYSGLQDLGGPFGQYYHTVDTPFTGSYTSHHSAYGFTVGYQANRYFGMEAGYLDLGEVEIKGVVTFPPILPLERLVDDTVKVHGFLVDATARYPIAYDWSLYARAGEFLSHVAYEQGPSNSGPTANSTKFTYGAGVVWKATEHIGFRLGWDRFSNLGDMNSTGEFGLNLLSLGVVYSL